MTALAVTSSILKTYMKFWGNAFKFWLRPSVRCQKDLLLSSETCHVFELDIPCFYPDLFMFRVFPFFKSDFLSFSGWSFPLFQIISSHFSSHTFSFLGESFLFSKSFLPIFRVRPSHFFGWVLTTFPSQSFSFSESDLPIYSGRSFSFSPNQSCPLFLVTPTYFI